LCERRGTTNLGAVQAGSLYPVTSCSGFSVNKALGGGWAGLALQLVLPQSSSAAVSTRCSFCCLVSHSKWQCATQFRSQTSDCRPIASAMRTSGRAVFFHWSALARHSRGTSPPLPSFGYAGGRTAESEQNRMPVGRVLSRWRLARVSLSNQPAGA
jgi:hypothetical protein